MRVAAADTAVTTTSDEVSTYAQLAFLGPAPMLTGDGVQSETVQRVVVIGCALRALAALLLRAIPPELWDILRMRRAS